MRTNKKILCTVLLTLLLCLFTVCAVQAQDIPNDVRYGRTTLATLSNGTNLVKVYDEIVSAANSKKGTIDIAGSYSITKDEALTIFEAYRNDNCNQFWVNPTMTVNFNTSTGKVNSVGLTYDSTLYGLRSKFDTAVNSIYDGLNITSGMSEFEKSMVIHDAVAQYLSYDSTKAGQYSHSVYGAVINKTCVCEGYAKMYQILMNKAGLMCHTIVGQAAGDGHAWNLNRIDGEYYLTDVTWDDQGSQIMYVFLNQDSKTFNTGHTPDETRYPLPTFNKTKGYYDVYGGKMTSAGNKEMLAAMFAKSDEIRVLITDDNYQSFWDNYKNIVVDVAAAAGFEPAFRYGYYGLGREFILYIEGTRIVSYTITVSGGKASQATSPSGKKITITANDPNPGYYFKGWKVDQGGISLKSSSATSTTFTMPAANVKVTAQFAVIPPLNFIKQSSFDIPSGNTGTAISSVDVSKGASGGLGTLTYTMTTGPKWLTISKDGKITGTRPATAASATSATIKVTDTQNQSKTITISVGAVILQEYTVSVTGGTASVTKAAKGTKVTVTANTPSKGMYFVKWKVVSGGVTLASTTSTSTTFTVQSANVSVEAVFEKIPELVFTKQSSFDIPQGNISTAISSIDVSKGVSGGLGTKTYSISGPSWLTISKEGKITGTRPSAATAATTATVKVTDAQNQTKSITINVGAIVVPEYSVSVTGGTASASKAVKGAKITLTANTPASGMYFVKWNVKSGNASLSSSTSTTATFTMPSANVSVEAVFEKMPALVIASTSFSIPEGKTGVAINSLSVASAVSGGKAPYSFTKTSGPSWLNVSSSGTVTGTRPSSSATAATLSIQVKDAFGQTKTITVSVGKVTAPETTAPKTTAPQTTVPPTTAPQTTVPPTTAPQTTVPPTTAPQTTVPPTTAPQTTVPPTTAPETTVPPTTVPETTEPQTTIPETTKPETTIPETTTSAPETTQPETSAPATTAPETTASATTEAAVTTAPASTAASTTSGSFIELTPTGKKGLIIGGAAVVVVILGLGIILIARKKH